MQEILEKAGLSKNESRVYLALLELGVTSSKQVIEKTHLHIQTIYDSLELLIEKGLVSFVIKANRKHFKASDPKRFFDYFESREEELVSQKEEFKKILSKLSAKRELSREKQETTVYSGNKGLKSLMDDMLDQNHEILTIGASDTKAEAFQYHLEFNLPKFHTFRVKKKIPYKILLSEDLKKRANELNKLKNSEAKVLPKEFTSNSSFNIYGNKVSIIMWGSEPFGILIKSKEIADAQRRHFNLLWKIAKK
jgi:sugar-specific transcriptional regulator TrmB